MDWFEDAKKKRELNPKYGYGSIAKDYGLTWDTVRSRFRREEKKKATGGFIQKDILVKTEQDSCIDIESISNKIYEVLKDGKEQFTATICNKVQISPEVLELSLEELWKRGIQLIKTDETVEIVKTIPTTEFYHKEEWLGDKTIRFGVVSDTHLGSFWQQITHLNTMYDIFEREGIDTVYHCGDITEGVNMRVGQKYECFSYGVDNQTNYVVQNYPKRKNILTKFIIGNHDTSGIKSAGVNIGEIINYRRDDMEYLGVLNAKVELTPNCILELNHPLDGANYAFSYSLQKTIDAMSGGEKPSILLNGHHHKFFTMFYRNIHALEVATFESQTPWMRGKRIAAHMGGTIITAHVNEEGFIQRFSPEFFPFYKAIPNDY